MQRMMTKRSAGLRVSAKGKQFVPLCKTMNDKFCSPSGKMCHWPNLVKCDSQWHRHTSRFRMLPVGLLAQTCQNGGVFDVVRYTCVCTVQAYGSTCETRFADLSPCRNATAAGVITIRDSASAHAARQFDACSTASGRLCIDFSTISITWYRFESPSGNYLVAGDYPCVAGAPIGCGTGGGDVAFTLRQQAFEGTPESGTKLYSAKAFAFAPSSPQCYDSGFFYNVRVLECPDKSLLYYMEPAMTSSHRYCIGVYGSASTTSAPVTSGSAGTTAKTLNAGAASTTATSTANPAVTVTIANPAGTSATANPAGTSTTANPAGTTTTANPAGTSTTANPAGTTTTANLADRSGWNTYVDDGNPYFHINTTGLPNASSLSCNIRSNSLQASFSPIRSAAVSKSTGLFCDFAPVLQWLTENKRIYVNCVVDVLTSSVQTVSSAKVTVCQSWYRGRPVRRLSERSQCTVEDDVDSYRPSAWRQWFGDL